MTYYSLWEVILNGYSLAPTRVVEGVLQPVAPTTAEQGLARKNELKACGTLLMALPDKHQLKFNSHKDAKTLMEAIENRFGGNTETNKVQKTLLKQHYKNFTGSSSESLDHIHDRLQKLVSQLEIHRRNKADLKEQSLDDLFNSLKIYEAEVKHSSSIGTISQNLAFVSSSNTNSTTESVNASVSISVVCTKMPVSSLPNVDSLSNAMIYSFFSSQSYSPQLDNEDLKQIDVDDLKDMDLRWQMAMLTIRARRFLEKAGRNFGANRPTSMGFHMSIVECYNCHIKGHFARECSGVGSYDWSFQTEEEPVNYTFMAFSSSSSSSDNEVVSYSKDCSKAYAQLHSQYDKLLADFCKSQFDVISYQTSLESVEARLLVNKQNEYVFEEDIKLLNLEVQLRDNTLFTLRQKLEKAEQERDDLKLKLEKLSLTKPDQELSLTNRPSAAIIEDWVSDSEDESKTKAPQINPSFVQSTEQLKSPSPFVQHVETSIHAATPNPASPKPTSPGKRGIEKRALCAKGYHKQYAPMTHQNPQKHMVPVAVLTRSKPVLITAVRPVSADVPKLKVTRPRHAKPIITKSKSTTRRHITHSLSPKASNSPPKVTAVKAPMILRSSMVDMLPLEVTQLAVRFLEKEKSRQNSVLFTDTECLVLSPDSKLPDASQVLLRVPRENNMYNVNLKNIVPSRDLTCFFAKATIDESNLWHRRMAYINFKTMNKLVKGNLVRGLPTKVFENANTCVACKKGKQHRASCKTKPVSSVDQPLYRLYMDLFGPTFVKSLNKKSYCLVVTDDYNRFTWVFFLATKDETSPILKTFITGLENQLSLKAEAVNTACYVQNRVLVIKPHNKTPYELLHGRTPSIGFMRPYGCPVTILNTLDSLGKFEGKVDEGFLVGYSVNSSGPTWLFDINSLTKTMNYQPITAGNQTNPSAAFQDKFDAEKAEEEIDQQYVLFPVWSFGSTNPQNTDGDVAFNGKEPNFDKKKPESEVNVSPSSSAQSRKLDDKTKKKAKEKSLVDTNTFSAVGPSNAVGSPTYGKSSFIDASQLPDDHDMPELEDITYSDDEDNVSTEADFNNLETSITVSLIPTTRVHKDHPMTQIIGDLSSNTQTRSMTRVVKDQGTKQDLSYKDTQEKGIDYEEVFAPVARIEAIRLFLAYASFMGFMVYQIDVKSTFLYGTIEEEVYVCQPLGFEDPSYPDKVYNVVKTLYGLHQAPRAWYETLANYLLENDDIIFGATNKDLCKSFEKLMKDKFQISLMGELTFFLGLQVKQKKDGIFISQDKYVDEILRKFRLQKGKSASTPIDTEKPLLKDPSGKDVDVHTYKSVIGSLMYLTSSRPDIMFAVCACVRFQVTPKASYLHAVKRIFRYLKGKPHLGLWYPKKSPFDLAAYSDSDYAGASLDRKSTSGGCHFLRCRLISWQCKKQTVIATSSTKAKYVAAASCCAQVLWIQNQLLDYSDSPLLGVNIPRCDEDRLELKELTVFLLPKVNDVTRLQALVDKKKVVVTKATIREALRLDDEEGVDCLPNKEIFTELARIGYEKPSTKLTFYKAFFSSQWKFLLHTILQCTSDKRTSWNEFSSSMASAIICLSSGDLLNHTTKYTSPALTQKVFANIRRVGKGFSGVKTPLFEGMLVEQQVVEEGDADENDETVNAGDVAEGDVSATHGTTNTTTITSYTTTITLTSTSAPTRCWNPYESSPRSTGYLRVKKIERKNKVRVLKLRRLQRVGTSQRVETSDETMMDNVSNQRRMIAEIDHDVDVVLKDDKEVADEAKEEDETEPAEVQELVDVVTTAKLITEVVTATSKTATVVSAIITAAEAQVPAAITAVTLTAAPARVTAAPSIRKKGVVIKDLQEESTTSTIIPAKTKSKDKAIDHVKKKEKEDPAMDYLKGMSYDDIRLIFEAKFNTNVAFLLKTKEQIEEDEKRALKRLNETPTERAAKRQKLDEEIIELNNKPYYKIIRADDTHQLYIWKTQRNVHGPAKVKGWKLLESCGVHIITFTSTQLILLEERKYPLTRFTLDQMLNAKRLEVEEESEVSLELLRFIRQQHQEGQLE
uniref:Putative ribonuclease H-like domain-containing protein n=1 Tax=Tanacetum cinerariifolium TaxID=118510 RepID=A0A6L2NPU4_TANCI|nr:putative ribonuclease H-like domain-containing protein [Tanacetum cinerariifolium]